LAMDGLGSWGEYFNSMSIFCVHRQTMRSCSFLHVLYR
jgi:hypothetical protein